jgi:hypothetical protein
MAATQALKARGFITDQASGLPLAGVPVTAVAELDGGRRVPISLMASDRAGYVSLDLSGLGGLDPLVHVWVYPVADEDAKVDLLPHTADGSRSTPFILRTNGTRVSYDGDVSAPTLRRPDPRDWDVSPTSFSVRPDLVLGDGACQVPVPATAAEHEYFFTQLVRRRMAGRRDDRDALGRMSAVDGLVSIDSIVMEPLDSTQVRAPRGRLLATRWGPSSTACRWRHARP